MDQEKHKSRIRATRRGDEPVTNDDLDEALEIHAEKERAQYEALIGNVMRAFPDGDVEGHRQYHTSRIAAAKAEKEFWDSAKHKLIEQGVSGVVRVLMLIVIFALLGVSAKYGIAIPFLPKSGN